MYFLIRFSQKAHPRRYIAYLANRRIVLRFMHSLQKSQLAELHARLAT
jgi:hypothetical protein